MPWASGYKPYPTAYTCRRLMMQCRRLSPPHNRLHTCPHHPIIATPLPVDPNMYHYLLSMCNIGLCSQETVHPASLHGHYPTLDYSASTLFSHTCTPSHTLSSISPSPRTTRRRCELPPNLSYLPPLCTNTNVGTCCHVPKGIIVSDAIFMCLCGTESEARQVPGSYPTIRSKKPAPGRKRTLWPFRLAMSGPIEGPPTSCDGNEHPVFFPRYGNISEEAASRHTLLPPPLGGQSVSKFV